MSKLGYLMCVLVVLAVVAVLYYLYASLSLPLGFYYQTEHVTVFNQSQVCTGCTGTSEDVWVASTLKQQNTGMMNRYSFEGEYGMLFVYQSQQQLCFWMENTPIPMRQVWINQSGYVTAVYNATPYNTTPVCSYGTYVLEMPENENIGIGYRIII